MDLKSIPNDARIAAGIIGILIAGTLIVFCPTALAAILIVATIYGAYETGRRNR